VEWSTISGLCEEFKEFKGFKEFKEFRSSGVQEFRSSGVQEFIGGMKQIAIQKTGFLAEKKQATKWRSLVPRPAFRMEPS